MLKEEQHRPTVRVLNILKLLSESKTGLTLTEIAKNIDAPKSSISPVIHTMVEEKFIFNIPDTNKYVIGIESFCVGISYTNNMDSFTFIKKEMENIVKASDEICQMGILDKDQVLYIAKVNSENPIQIVSHVGKKLPAYCTALGKALLHQKTKKELDKLYPEGFKKYTKNTITDLETFKKQLNEISDTAIAYEFEEINQETVCFATPLLYENEVIAAISVSIPSFRAKNEKIEFIKKLLLNAKKKIEIFFKDNGIDKFSYGNFK